MSKFTNHQIALARLMLHAPRACLAISMSPRFSPARLSSGRIAHRATAVVPDDVD